MRILHTADWHIGIKLQKKELAQDHELFFGWLMNLIKERDIEVLLISGDVFDQANPSSEARHSYYSFLKKLININCKVIITGGNHDSPAVLNGPKDILAMLNINIIGNVPANTHDEIIEVKNKGKEIECIVCAVPYLRDSDIRIATEGESFKDRMEQKYLAIKNHLKNVVDSCIAKYGEGFPIILMCHLFASGATTSDSEREIRLGELDMFNSIDFPDSCKYIALGHIHRPQRVGKNENIRYSGSPIPLSFSEKSDEKIVLELDVSNKCIQTITAHNIPVTRMLKKFTGTLKQVEEALKIFRNDKKLKAFADLEIIEESIDPLLQTKVHKLITEFESEDIDILSYKIKTTKSVFAIQELFNKGENIEDLTPKEILLKKLEKENVPEEQKKIIAEAFDELLAELIEKS